MLFYSIFNLRSESQYKLPPTKKIIIIKVRHTERETHRHTENNKYLTSAIHKFSFRAPENAQISD